MVPLCGAVTGHEPTHQNGQQCCTQCDGRPIEVSQGNWVGCRHDEGHLRAAPTLLKAAQQPAGYTMLN